MIADPKRKEERDIIQGRIIKTQNNDGNNTVILIEITSSLMRLRMKRVSTYSKRESNDEAEAIIAMIVLLRKTNH